MKILEKDAVQVDAPRATAGGAGPDLGESSLLDAIRALAPEISARAEETEKSRGMAPDLMAKLREAGLFRMLMPEALGGLELSQLQAVRVIEELGKADGSAGWNAMVIFGFNAGFSRFPRKTVEEIFSKSPDVVARGALAPQGRAVETEGGYIFNGQWSFASGSYTPEWIVASAIVMEDGKPKIGPGGTPELRMGLTPGPNAEFLDTWHTMGLAGSASHDFVLKDQFIPTAYTTNFFDLSLPSALETKLLQLPFRGLTGPTHSAVTVGIAQGAIDEVAGLAKSKRSAFNPAAILAEDPVFQHRLGKLAARLCVLRANMYRQCEETARRVEVGTMLGPMDFAASGAVVSYTQHECVDIVNELFALMSSTPVYSKSALQRRWRDVRAGAQHFGANESAYTSLGALLAGVGPGLGPRS